MAGNTISALCTSLDGKLWMGTNGANILEYGPESGIVQRHFPGYEKSGYVGGGVKAILEDHTGLIWFAVPQRA